MKSLEGRVAVVAGASRGAGRGIALALGSAGCTVYSVGRTSRAGAPATDGAPGTVEDTAEGVTDRGGRGVAVVADCGDPSQAAAVVDRVRQEQGRLDVLANAVWGGHDGVVTPADLEAAWGRPFWEQPARQWATMMTAGPCAYYLMSAYAIPLMLDLDGNISESNAHNFFLVLDGKLCTPLNKNVLDGITKQVVHELAANLEIEVVEGNFTAYDAYNAEEAFLASTSPTIMAS